MNNGKVSYDNGLLKIISEDMHYGLETVHSLMSYIKEQKFDLVEDDSKYRGIELGIVTPYHTDLGAFPRIKIPLNHGSNNLLNLIRTYPSSPGVRNNIAELLEDIPQFSLPSRFIPDPKLYMSNVKEHYVEDGKGSMLKLLEIAYVGDKRIKGSKNINFEKLLSENEDADMIFVYAKDNPKVNSILKHSGLKYARGNVGRDSEDRLFVWYKNI